MYPRTFASALIDVTMSLLATAVRAEASTVEVDLDLSASLAPVPRVLATASASVDLLPKVIAREPGVTLAATIDLTGAVRATPRHTVTAAADVAVSPGLLFVARAAGALATALEIDAAVTVSRVVKLLTLRATVDMTTSVSAPAARAAKTLPADVELTASATTASRSGISVSDNFNRANSSGLGPNWTLRNGSVSPRILSNAVAHNGTTAGFFDATYNTPASGADQFVQAKITGTTNASSALLLRGGANGVVMALFVNNTVAIYTATGWSGAGGANRSGDINTGLVLANRIARFEAVGNVYSLFIDGTRRAQWTDTGATWNGNRLGGLATQRRGPTNSGGFDDWSFGDLV